MNLIDSLWVLKKLKATENNEAFKTKTKNIAHM